MKGVVAAIDPAAAVIDLTHGVAPQDVTGGALALAAAVDFFPAGAVHVAVVDPGVGGDRRPILVETDRACFIGPDNGVLSLAAGRQPADPKHPPLQSRTITAPTATRSTAGTSSPGSRPRLGGVPLERLGEAVEGFEP